MIEAKIICDSICDGKRITTFELKYPRFILAQLNTHRVFSRSTSSSRAIPTLKLLKSVISDPVYPLYWGVNKSGMQADSELSGIKLSLAKFWWRAASISAVAFSYGLTKLGLHKQIANRIIEPWLWTNTVVTSTEWDNFFSLRCEKHAQPEIEDLANKIREAYINSVPKVLYYSEWHLPYITKKEKDEYSINDLLKMSTARCARVSYLNHDGKVDIKKDFELYERLVVSEPKHASPAEHQATPLVYSSQKGYTHMDSDFNMWSANFCGWVQHRQILD